MLLSTMKDHLRTTLQAAFQSNGDDRSSTLQETLSDDSPFIHGYPTYRSQQSAPFFNRKAFSHHIGWNYSRQLWQGYCAEMRGFITIPPGKSRQGLGWNFPEASRNRSSPETQLGQPAGFGRFPCCRCRAMKPYERLRESPSLTGDSTILEFSDEIYLEGGIYCTRGQ
jgi:hypothetical protein